MPQLEHLLSREWQLQVEEEPLENARLIRFQDGQIYVDGTPAGAFKLQVVAPIGEGSEMTIGLDGARAGTLSVSVISQIPGDQPLFEYASLTEACS